MIFLDDNDYRSIAARLLESIGDGEFYNGSIEYESAEYTSVLRATLIIYREPLFGPDDPGGTAMRITDIVPVWWEFHLYDALGEQINGFSWRELKEHLI